MPPAWMVGWPVLAAPFTGHLRGPVFITADGASQYLHSHLDIFDPPYDLCIIL